MSDGAGSSDAQRRHQPGSLPRPFDGVIFDCDGVLVDSERISNGVWAEMLTELGLPMTTEDSLRIFLGNSMQRCLQIVEELMGHAPPADLLPRFHLRARAALERLLTPVDGIVEVLDALDAVGIRYGVASNGEHEKMRITLGVTGLLERFEGRRFSARDVAHPKPAPDLFLHAAAALGFAPARTIVVEDSPLGVTGATTAGMFVIGFAELVAADRLTSAGAARTVAHLQELTPLLLGEIGAID